MTYTLPAALLAPVLLVLALYALRWLLDAVGHPGTVRALQSVGLTEALQADVLACFYVARAADRRTWWYDVSAPIVVAIALLFTKREASRLPTWAAKWDNNISLNGDSAGVIRDGRWLQVRDPATWPLRPGEREVSYDDPAYGGDAYYAEGHHPRSFWARYVWVGLRNRASQLSKDLGELVTERPVCISGNPDIHRNGPYGHFLLKSGNCYHYKSINRWHGLALIRSYGYKLEIVRNSQDGTGLAAAVAIGRSLKRRKAES